MAAIDDALRDFRLNAYYRTPSRDRSSFTSSEERSALYFYARPDGRTFLIQTQAPYVIQQIQRAFGVNPVDGRFGPQTLQAVRAQALREGITLPNQLTAQVMSYALQKAIHRGSGIVAIPARFELPDVDRPNLSTSRSTFLGAIDIATGQPASIDPGTGTVGAGLPAPAASAPSPSTAIAPRPAAPSPVVVQPNVNIGQPSLTEQPTAAPRPVVVAQAGMFGDFFPESMRGLFGGGAPASPCPPCNTVGPAGQCKPMDPRDCNPAAVAAQASVGVSGALRNVAVMAGVAIVAGTGAIAIANANRSAAEQRVAAAKEAKGDGV